MFESKVIAENIFSKKRLFLEVLLCGDQTVNLGSNLRSPLQKSVKEISNSLSRGAIALVLE